MPVQTTALRAPRLASALTMYLGTINVDSPLTPGGESTIRASTKCTMFSVIVCSPELMKILAPSSL
jgi:hypothetical protein